MNEFHKKTFGPILDWIDRYAQENDPWKPGEGKMFILNDCCVFVTIGNGVLNVQVVEGEPVKINHTSGLFDYEEKDEKHGEIPEETQKKAG